MTSITEFAKGDHVRIKALECEQEFKRRLAEMGLFDGAEVEIIKNDRKSPLLIKIFDSKIVLGQAGAKNIYGEKV